MQSFLIVSPSDSQAASGYHRLLAHAAYRIGEDSSLLRRNLPLQSRGGLLCISDRNAPLLRDPHTLCSGILRECSRRNYQGILLDFEKPLTPDRVAFIRQLEQALRSARRTLYLPESCADIAPGAVGLICTALSGGTLEQRLTDAIEHRGHAEQLALDVQRLRMDFTLPARSGEGVSLSREVFQALLQREKPSTLRPLLHLYAKRYTSLCSVRRYGNSSPKSCSWFCAWFFLGILPLAGNRRHCGFLVPLK